MPQKILARLLFLKPGYFSIYRNKRKKQELEPAEFLQQAIVLYDHACPLCRAEMRHLKQLDVHARLVLIDINGPYFDEQVWEISLQQARAALHVLTNKNEWLIGMDAVRYIYRQVGLGWLMAPTGWPLLSPIFNLLYRGFAARRTHIANWLGLQTSCMCSDSGCSRLDSDTHAPQGKDQH